MPLTDYAGADGIISSKLEEMLPGGFSYILWGIGIVLLLGLISRARSLGEKTGEMLGYYFGLGLVSFLLFKSVWTWSGILVVLVLFQAMGSLHKMGLEYGSRAERNLQREQGINPDI